MAEYKDLPDGKNQEPGKITNKKVTLTQSHFSRIFGSNGNAEWFSNFKKYCDEKGIDTVFRLSAFFAQISVETGKLGRLEENLNYSAARLVQVFPKYFQSKERANEYAGQPKKIASRVYANRMANGDEASGDGWTYRGRGCIQLTGKYNYEACTKAGVSCMGANADYLLTKEGAVRSAVWFWTSKGLNATADRGDFATVSRVINGGTNGWSERNAEYARILKILSELPENVGVETDPGAEGGEYQVDPVVPIDDTTPPIPPDSAVKNINEPIEPGKPVYPMNKAFESRSGHIIEIDDTPDRERLQWFHRSGTYTEFQPLGDRVEKTIGIRYVFSAETREVITGNHTSVTNGNWYTKTGGNQTHHAARVDIVTQGGVNVTAPVAKFSNIVDSEMIVTSFIKVRRGSKFGNVQDMKVRQATYADAAGRLGGRSVISGEYTGPDWVNRGEGVHTIAGHAAHEPTDIPDGQWSVANVPERGVVVYGTGLELQSAGNLFQRVDGNVNQTNGGDRVETTEGTRVVASGRTLTLASNTQVEVVAPAGLRADVVVHKRRATLPDHTLYEEGDIITVNLNGRLVHKLRGIDGWEEMSD